MTDHPTFVISDKVFSYAVLTTLAVALGLGTISTGAAVALLWQLRSTQQLSDTAIKRADECALDLHVARGQLQRDDDFLRSAVQARGGQGGSRATNPSK